MAIGSWNRARKVFPILWWPISSCAALPFPYLPAAGMVTRDSHLGLQVRWVAKFSSHPSLASTPGTWRWWQSETLHGGHPEEGGESWRGTGGAAGWGTDCMLRLGSQSRAFPGMKMAKPTTAICSTPECVSASFLCYPLCLLPTLVSLPLPKPSSVLHPNTPF